MIINPRLELAVAIRDAYRTAERKQNNKFKKGWKLTKARKQFYARSTINKAVFETVEEFLARGGKITKVPSAEF